MKDVHPSSQMAYFQLGCQLKTFQRVRLLLNFQRNKINNIFVLTNWGITKILVIYLIRGFRWFFHLSMIIEAGSRKIFCLNFISLQWVLLSINIFEMPQL